MINTTDVKESEGNYTLKNIFTYLCPSCSKPTKIFVKGLKSTAQEISKTIPCYYCRNPEKTITLSNKRDDNK